MPAATPPPRQRSAAARLAPRLEGGARLLRTWRGRPHEVTVLEQGKAFEYRGTRYPSLSEIARLITGTRWSGPRFFGLARHPGKQGRP